jgi:FecR protein
MKKFQVVFAAVLCGALFGLAVNASADTPKSGSATVVRVDGPVSYQLGDGKWIPLVAGKILPVGATVRTGENGLADLVLGKDVDLPQHGWQDQWSPSHVAPAPDSNVRGMISYRAAAEQNVIRLSPNTTLQIKRLEIIDTGADSVSNTELDLKQGKIYNSVKKLNGASQYLITLPNGIAGVRGTKFSITADGETSCYETKNGGVVLTLVPPGGMPKTTVVGEGFTFNPSTGQLTIMSGDESTFMARLFSALQTIYSPVAFVEDDHGHFYISPTHGGHGPPGGHHHHAVGE